MAYRKSTALVFSMIWISLIVFPIVSSAMFYIPFLPTDPDLSTRFALLVALLGLSFGFHFILWAYYFDRQELSKDVKLQSHLTMYREAKNISQNELADLLQVRKDTLLKLEQGQYCPSLDLAVRIAKAVGVSVEEIFQLKC